MQVKLTIFVVWIMWINYPQTADAIPVSILSFVSHNLNSIAMENQKEIWKDVKGYEGLYQVSSIGRAKSLDRLGLKNKRIKGKYLSPSINRGGYLQIVLYKNGVKSTRSIHQLVAEVFLNHTPCGFKLVVNHIDINKLNNHVSNLEVITQRENANKKHIKHTSKFTGVYWSKKNNKWGAVVRLNGKNIYLGYFKCENSASLYYENALVSIKNNTKIEIKKPNTTSKLKGVFWDKNSKKWASQIEINGKGIRLGSFCDEYEASLYYQNALIAKKQNKDIKIKKSTFTSKYTGVYWHKRDKKWVSSIKICGKNTHLGYFETELNAHNAYLNQLKKII